MTKINPELNAENPRGVLSTLGSPDAPNRRQVSAQFPDWLSKFATLTPTQFSNLPQFVRFLLVGSLNTAFGYTLFGAIYLFTGRPNLAVVTATIIGVVFNFFSTGRLVFAYRGGLAFIPFVLGYSIVCILNVVALGQLITQGLHPLLGQMIVLPLCVLLSFAINRYIFLQRTV